jgi:hypothetical protein
VSGSGVDWRSIPQKLLRAAVDAAASSVVMP